MSDLLCVPLRPGWQVGISERRNLYRPRRCAACQGCAAREPTSRPHPIQELDRADVLHDFLHGSRPVGRFLGEHLPDQL
jgi:hypothetical protein